MGVFARELLICVVLAGGRCVWSADPLGQIDVEVCMASGNDFGAEGVDCRSNLVGGPNVNNGAVLMDGTNAPPVCCSPNPDPTLFRCSH